MRIFSAILLTSLISASGAVILSKLLWKPPSPSTGMNAGLDLTHAAARGRSTVAWIQNQDDHGHVDTASTNAGSGMIISADGYIITNYHVVKDHNNIHVTLSDHHEYRATFIGADSTMDVAVIRIDASGLPHLTFGNSDSLLVGQQVIAVGNPHRMQSSIQSGIISALNRPARLPNHRVPYFIQSDIPISNGSSGGGMLNVNGELIGMMIGIVSSSGAYEGISLAIPGNILKNITEQLIDSGKSVHGTLQMSIRSVTRDDALAAGLTIYEGVVVDAITEGSTADRSGLRSLDIITTWAGTPIPGKKEFMEKLKLSKPGDRVLFGLKRGQEQLTIEVILE